MELFKKSIVASFVFLSSFSYSATSDEATQSLPSESLQEAIVSAIEKNPEVQEKWHSFLSAGYGYNAARSGYRPKVDLGVGYDLHRQDYGPNRSYHGAYGEITLQQMLYDGSFTRSEVSQFNNLQLASYFELLDSTEQVAFSAFSAYLDVIRQRELVELARENLSKHHKVYTQVQESAKAGVARSADLEQINGRLALAQSNLVVEMSNLHDISARYLRVVGSLPPAALDSFEFSDSTLPANIQETLLLAYQGSPVYHAALRRILAAESASDAAKSDYRPKVHVNARYGSQTYDGLGYDEGQSEASIGIELRYNLYNGGKHRANIRRSLQEVNVAKDQRDLACINIRQNVQITYNDTLKLAEQLPILNRHRLASSKVATAYKQQFDIGQRTLLDVLDIENELFQAGRAWVNAYYDLEISRAKTLSSMGTLVHTMGLQRSNLPSLGDLGAEPIEVDEATACPAVDINAQEPMLVDTDQDGVPDVLDQCPDTPLTDRVDEFGCSYFEEKEVTHKLNIQFAKESAIVRQEFYAEVAELAKFLQRYRNTDVKLEGHSSLGGSDAYNLRLSKQRADAVAAILASEFNIDPERISTTGYGIQQLVLEGRSEEIDTINRRVEAFVVATITAKAER